MEYQTIRVTEEAGGVGTIALTAYVGHSGATMVWKDIIANTKAIGEGGEAVAK